MLARQLIVCAPGAHNLEQGWLTKDGQRQTQILAFQVKNRVGMPNTTAILSGPFGWECETAEIITSTLRIEGLSPNRLFMSRQGRIQIEAITTCISRLGYETVIAVTGPEICREALYRVYEQFYHTRLSVQIVLEPGTAVCLDFENGGTISHL